MDASLFSWPGFLISLLVVVAIFAIAFFVIRGIVRFTQQRQRERVEKRVY